MKLLFKQRMFSWFDSYDVYREDGSVAYTVEGKLAWGHKLIIYDGADVEVGRIEQHPFRLLPKFDCIENDCVVDSVCKKFSFFKPRYRLNSGWQIEGSVFGWEYCVIDTAGRQVAAISKELFRFTDTYVLEYFDTADELRVLMTVLAIDAANCSSS